MEKLIDISQAEVLGAMAFLDGKKRVPCLDPILMEMIRSRPIGHGRGEKKVASSVELMKAWTRNWDLANLARN